MKRLHSAAEVLARAVEYAMLATLVAGMCMCVYWLLFDPPA